MFFCNNISRFNFIFSFNVHYLPQSQLSQQWIVECTGFQMKSSLFHTPRCTCALYASSSHMWKISIHNTTHSAIPACIQFRNKNIFYHIFIQNKRASDYSLRHIRLYLQKKKNVKYGTQVKRRGIRLYSFPSYIFHFNSVFLCGCDGL